MKSSLQLRHDPDGTTSYGYYRCQDCGSAMFGGGPFIHKKGCTRTAYEGLEYYMGDKAILVVLGGTGNLNPIDADELRRQLPDDVARLERNGTK